MRRLLSPTTTLALLMVASSAGAHISLLDPPARYDGSVGGQSKACPCGVGESNRLCNVDGDRSDPDRSTRVTTLEPGSTVTLRWDEYVGHAGRYRIAFDDDGADLEDFNANVLLDFVDPPSNGGNTGSGSIWEVEVTVPDTPCDNCTLQLIQMMDGDMSAPVQDPVGRSTYYQCADIIIASAPADMGTPAFDAGAPDLGRALDLGPGPEPAPDLGPEPAPTDTGSTSTPRADTDGGADLATDLSDGGLAKVNGTGGCGVVSNTAGAPLAILFLVFALRRRIA